MKTRLSLARVLRVMADAVLCLLCAHAPLADAQSAKDGFDPRVNGTVRAIVKQPDGCILIGGQFTSVGGLPRTNLARLNVDGSVVASFSPRICDPVFSSTTVIAALALQPDGKILIGGWFTLVDNESKWCIARLLSDGSVDASFSADANGTVFSLVVQADGKILAGGDFTTIGGQTRMHLARLNSSGSIDTSFGAEPDGGVFCLLALPDRSTIVGGGFSRVSGQVATNLVKLKPDGSLDGGFRLTVGGAVKSLALQVDGKILVAGDFSQFGEMAQSYVGRLHADGRVDTAFQPQVDGSIRAVAVQADGRILIGGFFHFLENHLSVGLARLNPEGSRDPSFAPTVQPIVLSLIVQPDGKIIFGEALHGLCGTDCNHLSRLYPDGSVDATMITGANAQPSAITPLPDGSMIVGGNFLTVGGKARSRIAKIKPDGSVDDLFISDVAPQAFYSGSFVRTVLLQTDGRILIGGNLSNVAGTTFTNLARVNPDGSADGSFKPYSSMFSSIAIQRDGKILTGTDGSGIGPVYEKSVRRHNSDGTPDPSFNTALQTPPVYTVAVREDGKVLVGGSFVYTNGPNATGINLALFNTNGTFDANFAISAQDSVSGVQAVNALLMQPDGSMLVGGHYERLGNYTCNGLGRVRADGSVDTNFVFAGVSGEIVGLALQADGRILVGGSFSFLGLPARSNLLRLNPDGSIDATFDAGVNGMVRGLSIGADGKVWLGGSFSTVAGIARTNLARLSQRDAAFQSLAMDGESITWTRMGTAPEVQQVTFEQSMNGANFAMLGYATWVTNGWRLGGLSLPVGQNFFIRARGRSISGRYSGSSGLIESVAQFWQLPPPLLNNVQVLGGGQFQFSFTNTNATAFTVLASTNAAAPLAQWESLGATVSVGGGTYQFTDPAATNHARRFYQLRSP